MIESRAGAQTARRGDRERNRSGMGRRAILLALGVAWTLSQANIAWAGDYYPLETEEARTVGAGNLRTAVEVGVRKQNDASELYNVPRLRVEYGLSEWVDLEMEYDLFVVEGTDVPIHRTSPPQIRFNQDDAGTGDLRLRLKMVPWELPYGDLGFHFETKLPMADDRTGLGTDGIDANVQFIYTVDWSEFTDAAILRDLTTHANLGIGVLSQPSRNREQNDYFLWSVAAEYPLTERLVLMGELDAAFLSDRTRNIAEGSESADSIVGRLAMTWEVTDDWTAGVTAAKGLTDDALDWELQLGMSRQWGIGYERPPPGNASPDMRWTDPEATFTYYNPLWTEEAQVIGPKRFRGEMAFGYVNQADGSDLYATPTVIAGWGIGPWADFEIEYAFLHVRDTDVVSERGQVLRLGKDGSETGDIRVHLKLVPFRLRVGDLGVKFTTKLPNASDEAGLGTDETDFIARVLLSSNWGAISSNSIVSRLTTHMNMGIAIQEDPFERSRQNDVFLWGAAAEYAITDDWTFWTEIHGAVGGDEVDNVAEGDYGDNQLVLRAGLTGPVPEINFLPDYDLFHDWKWSATMGAGLTGESSAYTAQIGFSHTWGIE